MLHTTILMPTRSVKSFRWFRLPYILIAKYKKVLGHLKQQLAGFAPWTTLFSCFINQFQQSSGQWCLHPSLRLHHDFSVRSLKCSKNTSSRKSFSHSSPDRSTIQKNENLIDLVKENTAYPFYSKHVQACPRHPVKHTLTMPPFRKVCGGYQTLSHKVTRSPWSLRGLDMAMWDS